MGEDGVEDEDGAENNADESAASDWLQDLGLDHRRYRSVDPSKVREYPLFSVGSERAVKSPGVALYILCWACEGISDSYQVISA